MMNDAGSPACGACARSMRTQAEWKVAMSGGRIPAASTRSSTRRRISSAALLVKVTARRLRGCTPSTPRSQAIRWAITRVLPLPAPASTRTGPRVAVTASRWAGLRGSRMTLRAIGPADMGLHDTTRSADRPGPGRHGPAGLAAGRRAARDGAGLPGSGPSTSRCPGPAGRSATCVGATGMLISRTEAVPAAPSDAAWIRPAGGDETWGGRQAQRAERQEVHHERARCHQGRHRPPDV